MARKGEKILRIAAAGPAALCAAAAWIVGRRLKHPPRKEKPS